MKDIIQYIHVYISTYCAPTFKSGVCSTVPESKLQPAIYAIHEFKPHMSHNHEYIDTIKCYFDWRGKFVGLITCGIHN